ncbi:DNA-directed RNA polymerase I subunit RPA2 [Trichonephila clavata]|uniref:DNA-directed RNA polymerase subunit beta n=1 Tax=Trichonephila clavata TaxID=2740835 RepID=A0A8X6I2B3_TRICU|nr:DNA-directed RNA polymerase I subunit RPA2 [Trichonephila clavata]
MPSLRGFQTPYFGIPKNKQEKVLQEASIAHVASFNYVLREGIGHVVKSIPPLEIGLPNGDRIQVNIINAVIGMPGIKQGTIAKTIKVYPAECRNRCVTYKGHLQLTISWSKNGVVQDVIEKTIGEVPIMVKSQACNLDKLTPKQLVDVGEEENEFGGYFIINGKEKVMRLLIVQRRNYPIAMQRNSWKKRGDLFTEYGVAVRSVRKDQSGTNLVMHYLSDGTVKIMFHYKREMYIVPAMIILKALVNEVDYYIYQQLIKGKKKDAFYQGCLKNMLRKVASEGIYFQEQALNYLGTKFAVKMNLPSWYSPADIAKFLIDQCICVHLDTGKEKFDFLVLMAQKLFALVKNECALESADSLMNQEILTPGIFYLIVLKEKLYSWLMSVKMNFDKKFKPAHTILNQAWMTQCFSQTMDITNSVENVLATGNFVPRYENSLQQSTGFVVVADKLNFWRYLSHFRAVHRGSFFTTMRTTTVRKLLPDAWGFLCPVHTPDGTPCGLLNHMALTCQVVDSETPTYHLLDLFCKYGMIPLDDPISVNSDFYIVLFDGKVAGRVLDHMAFKFVTNLRALKVQCSGEQKVPEHMEICFVSKTENASQYSGIFIFTTLSRMVRPVRNLVTNTTELIGTMEQVYLHIALKPEDVVTGLTFHEEIAPTNILSILANQIPYSDFNQSPRNMYECQMGKQTMGTSCLALRYRSDNKLYHLRTPQSPVVRPNIHDHFLMDDYPLGTNAIVAVISYTGYDMEDAMVLNKSSVERGFKHASIYKTEVINLRVISGDRGIQKTLVFEREKDGKFSDFIDTDGLPYIGTKLNYGDPICCYVDKTTNKASYVKYKSVEIAYVEDVKLLGNDTGTDTNQTIAIKYRIPRNPIIGDKFASRHGQKGICSIMFPVEDLPFTDSGMTPDIIFNPHGFPSRMTIGMMIESMAGKSAAIQGTFHDATPFTFSENNTAIEYFGECLKKAGYDYYGTEKMYSGVSGEELEADIFFGVVYYQRLRHMVSDKYQVRSTGPVDPLTRQPVKGRKREGGVRFGEMERDALIAHGASGLLHDRLFTCSDASQQYVCMKCQDLLSPVLKKQEPPFMTYNEWICRLCGSSEDVVLIDIPYVLRYLCVELAALNIKLNLKIGDFMENDP